MRETPWPLTRIAEAIGYPEPARFSAFFKKQNGLPPGRWRQDINITTAAILNART
jgi:AraC-like DNA-binding protein